MFEFDPVVPVANTAPVRTTKIYGLLTSLVNIPWDKPYFYLTPGEFHLLPKTSIVTKVQCQVVYRNTRQAFETNASTTSTATLNQYNDILFQV